MAFEELKENTNEVQENAKAYLESSIAYYKLWGFKVAMKSTTLMLKFFLIAICLSIVLLFVSVAGASASILSIKSAGFLANLETVVSEDSTKSKYLRPKYLEAFCVVP